MAPPKTWTGRWKRLVEFLDKDVWEPPPIAHGAFRATLLHNLRTWILVCEGTLRDHLLLRAGALTYKTVFAIVPFLAVMLAFFKGFGVNETVRTKIQDATADQLAPGLKEVFTSINDAISNVHAGALGGVALLVLLYTAISLLTTVEESFNHIWGVKEGRSFFWRCIIYWGVITLGPVVVMASVTATTLVDNSQLMVWAREHIVLASDVVLFAMPFLFAWAGLGFLYYFMPNTTVAWKSALAGGVIAGTAWEVAKFGYVHYVARTVTADAVYGKLLAVPLFLLWLYLSWSIVLFGAECAFAHQHVKTYRREITGEPASHATREALALQTMVAVVRDFAQGREPTTVRRIGETLNLPVRLVNDTIYELSRAGLVREVTGTPMGYVPGRDPATIPVKSVLDAVRASGSPLSLNGADPAGLVQVVLSRTQQAVERELSGMTVADLARTTPQVS